ncbi:hypothetical protein Q4561_15775 [Alteromonas sp. 1_MG-2023]|uniref:hypothetical protein n=1 Tax=Alteromonas sp. 1_MG-2023 TaxID=3062669 RepID=UPI0026E484E7|nr:hypothetical protein [Alteromonas sp. 1_MG-2023]MDO6568531.1 hypothetical protein [Alteromonas sp. 1_MG-2023]
MTKFDKTLDAEIQRLPQRREPERDLWRGIELSLHSKDSKVQNKEENSVAQVSIAPWLAMAASIMLVSVIWIYSPAFTSGEGDSDSTKLTGINSEQPGSRQANPPQSTPKQSKLAGYALVDALSQQQNEQMTALLASYDKTPELSENWQAQLEELDDAAGVIRAALKDDPSNRALLKMLQHVYQQQITLIERVHAPKWQQI